MKVLHLHLKFEYFDAIKNGQKHFEYRLASKWQKKLDANNYTHVRLYRGYQKASSATVIDRIYSGYRHITKTHKHFGKDPVEVCAIDVRKAA